MSLQVFPYFPDNKHSTVNFATGREALVATKWENPLIEVTCDNSVPEFCILSVLN